MKKLLALLCIPCLLAAFATGCKDKKGDDVVSDSSVEETVSADITLNTNKVGIYLGESFQLIPTVAEAKKGALVFWSVLNESVATVDDNGLVTAVGVGTTVCYAQCGETTVPCSITVYEKALTSSFHLAMDKTQYVLNVNDTYNLFSDISVRFGDKVVTEYTLTGEVNGDATAQATVENGELKAGAVAGTAELLLTVSATIDGNTYTDQQMITVSVY